MTTTETIAAMRQRLAELHVALAEAEARESAELVVPPRDRGD